MRVIGVLTSGGDSPGMNACVRSVVRTGLSYGIQTVGILRGYAGLIDGDTQLLSSRTVGGIARWGGTILQTARCKEFMKPEGVRRGVAVAREHGIEGIVVIGGDGSLHGAIELDKAGIPSIGVPASIDNDIKGTELSIGVDTAANTILEAIDRIKDTASSHKRAFLIEVMGRRSGYLAYAAGVAGGAEMVIAPEEEVNMEEIFTEIARAHERGKPHFIAVVAEGAKPNAHEIRDALEAAKFPGFEVRLTVLGHVQRGGSPTLMDRLLSTRLGNAAVKALVEGKRGIMVGTTTSRITEITIEEAVSKDRPVEGNFIELANMVAL